MPVIWWWPLGQPTITLVAHNVLTKFYVYSLLVFFFIKRTTTIGLQLQGHFAMEHWNLSSHW